MDPWPEQEPSFSMTAGRKVWSSVLGDLERGFMPGGVFPESGKVNGAGWLMANVCCPD